MKYKPNTKNDFPRACGINKVQETRLLNAMQKAFDSISDSDFSIDEVNAFVAPYIKSQEEAFFNAQTIIATVYGAAQSMGVKPINPNIN